MLCLIFSFLHVMNARKTSPVCHGSGDTDCPRYCLQSRTKVLFVFKATNVFSSGEAFVEGEDAGAESSSYVAFA